MPTFLHNMVKYFMNVSIIQGKGVITGMVFSIVLGWIASSALFAGEHPRRGHTAEQQKPRITKEVVAKFAEEYVGKNSQDGVFKHLDKKSIDVHKVNGKERYSWSYNKKMDLWERKAILTGTE